MGKSAGVVVPVLGSGSTLMPPRVLLESPMDMCLVRSPESDLHRPPSLPRLDIPTASSLLSVAFANKRCSMSAVRSEVFDVSCAYRGNWNIEQRTAGQSQ